jgi:hypothetical protein
MNLTPKVTRESVKGGAFIRHRQGTGGMASLAIAMPDGVIL